MSKIASLSKIDADLYRCDMCRKSVHQKDTLVLYNREKRQHNRLCRDCQLKAYMNELHEKNPAIDIKLKTMEYFKNIKDGIDGRR